MKKSLIIINNINKAIKSYQENQYDEIIFATTFKSKVQENSLQEIIKEIQRVIPKIKVQKLEDIKTKNFEDLYLSAWSSHDEKNYFKNYKKLSFISQNRLFERVNFNNKTFFTSFRKENESRLPDYFKNVFQYQSNTLNKHLTQYFSSDAPKNYFQTRNKLIGDSFSTKMSFFLSTGVLNVKFLYNQVKDYEKKHGSNKSTYWIIFELLWREFFFHSAQYYKNKYFSLKGIRASDKFDLPDPIIEEDLLNKIKDNELIYYAYHELIINGYMSNRLRQIFASFWINDLKLNWYQGAMLFEKYLIDYDVYSNYGNWQYLAGIGHDPRPSRYFNIKKQLNNYDPNNEYIHYWKEKLARS